MQLAGLKAAACTVKELELFEPDARLQLIPLLDDLDLAVRVFAARYLVKVKPDRAPPVLHYIRLRAATEVRVTAGRMIDDYERGKLDL